MSSSKGFATRSLMSPHIHSLVRRPTSIRRSSAPTMRPSRLPTDGTMDPFAAHLRALQAHRAMSVEPTFSEISGSTSTPDVLSSTSHSQKSLPSISSPDTDGHAEAEDSTNDLSNFEVRNNNKTSGLSLFSYSSAGGSSQSGSAQAGVATRMGLGEARAGHGATGSGTPPEGSNAETAGRVSVDIPPVMVAESGSAAILGWKQDVGDSASGSPMDGISPRATE